MHHWNPTDSHKIDDYFRRPNAPTVPRSPWSTPEAVQNNARTFIWMVGIVIAIVVILTISATKVSAQIIEVNGDCTGRQSVGYGTIHWSFRPQNNHIIYAYGSGRAEVVSAKITNRKGPTRVWKQYRVMGSADFLIPGTRWIGTLKIKVKNRHISGNSSTFKKICSVSAWAYP